MNRITQTAVISAAGLDRSVTIFLFVLSMIFAGAAIFFLIKGIKRDRKRRLEQIRNGDWMTKEVFDDMLKSRFSKATRFSRFSVIAVSINDAKGIRDSFGETQYDNALKTVMERLEKIFPAGSKICRYEYDEIAILVDGADDEELKSLAMYSVVECNKTVNMIANLLVEFNVNIAVVSYNEFNRTYEQLTQNLALTLVAGKRKGINQYLFHTAEVNNSETEEYKFYEEIKDAIEHNEFLLYYQPIVNLNTSETAGYESLLRWNHRTLGVLPPSKFLNIIDQSGDINWVGIWSFEQLLLQYTEWKRRNPSRRFFVSFNLSPKQLMNEKLIEELRQVMRKYKVDAADICIEIVEFALFDKMETVKNNINRLGQCGFKLAIDNYGPELNTLAMLEKNKVDYIKLEKDFIGRAKSNDFGKDIIAMLISYCEKSGVKLIAEGIEDADMLKFVKEMGITLGQGFYFGKPAAPEYIDG
jgi:diguanylate cyclase (GGDEF)-like protein